MPSNTKISDLQEMANCVTDVVLLHFRMLFFLVVLVLAVGFVLFRTFCFLLFTFSGHDFNNVLAGAISQIAFYSVSIAFVSFRYNPQLNRFMGSIILALKIAIVICILTVSVYYCVISPHGNAVSF